jgi:hypothetical protein
MSSTKRELLRFTATAIAAIMLSACDGGTTSSGGYQEPEAVTIAPTSKLLGELQPIEVSGLQSVVSGEIQPPNQTIDIEVCQTVGDIDCDPAPTSASVDIRACQTIGGCDLTPAPTSASIDIRVCQIVGDADCDG